MGSRQGDDSAYDCGRIGVKRGEAGELETVGPCNMDAEVASASVLAASVCACPMGLGSERQAFRHRL